MGIHLFITDLCCMYKIEQGKIVIVPQIEKWIPKPYVWSGLSVHCIKLLGGLFSKAV